MGKRLSKKDDPNKRLKKYLVSFDLILKKPVSESFSEISEGQSLRKKEIFYASDEVSLVNKVRLTYNCSGKVCNVNVLN